MTRQNLRLFYSRIQQAHHNRQQIQIALQMYSSQVLLKLLKRINRSAMNNKARDFLDSAKTSFSKSSSIISFSDINGSYVSTSLLPFSGKTDAFRCFHTNSTSIVSKWDEFINLICYYNFRYFICFGETLFNAHDSTTIDFTKSYFGNLF